MKSYLILFFIVIISGINGDPFLFFPEHMLPPIDTTYNFTFEGSVETWKISGLYAIQAVTSDDMKTVIGYRNWQVYTGGLNETFYGVSYFNSTYPQALVNPVTGECENAFSETVNCSRWLNIDILEWYSRCSIVRINSTITGEMSLGIRASNSDLKRPVHFTGTTYISGVPMNMTITYNFLSQTEGKNFPYIKCYF